MGGISMVDDWELPALSSKARTLVLFGRTGNGKSATGNSILGRKGFESRLSCCGVTSTSELQSTELEDGQVLNVIDTPGLFDSSIGLDNIQEEIIKCISLAKDGVDAVLLVLSIKTRFSKEEEDALESLQSLFGPKIINYVIVVFTNGDALNEDTASKVTLADYLKSSHQPLKVVSLCKNRIVLFDNKTKDKSQRIEQVQQLMKLVNMVRAENGRSYSINDLFEEFKKGAAMKLHDQEEHVKSLKECTEKEKEMIYLKEMRESYKEQKKWITQMVELKLRETTQRLEQQLAKEQVARVKAEKKAQKAQKKSSDEILELRQSLEKARKETEEFRSKATSGGCAIL